MQLVFVEKMIDSGVAGLKLRIVRLVVINRLLFLKLGQVTSPFLGICSTIHKLVMSIEMR